MLVFVENIGQKYDFGGGGGGVVSGRVWGWGGGEVVQIQRKKF